MRTLEGLDSRRLTPTGRRILVERVLGGRPIAHVAKELGISRTCAHRWISRYRAHGWDGLQDRSSRPKSCPHATPANIVDYTRLAYAEVLPDEKGPTCAGFLTRPAAVMAANGRRKAERGVADQPRGVRADVPMAARDRDARE